MLMSVSEGVGPTRPHRPFANAQRRLRVQTKDVASAAAPPPTARRPPKMAPRPTPAHLSLAARTLRLAA